MRQENRRQREVAVAQPQAEPPEDQHESAGGREGRRPVVFNREQSRRRTSVRRLAGGNCDGGRQRILCAR